MVQTREERLAYFKKRYKEKREELLKKARERKKKHYIKNKEEYLAKQRKARQSPKYKAYKRDVDARPETKKKQNVRGHTRRNKPKTNTCANCGGNGTEFHHISYKPPVSVELCKNCHNTEHKELETYRQPVYKARDLK